MIIIKPTIYKELCNLSIGEDNVYNTYPTDWTNFPIVEYTEEGNNVYQRTLDNKESYSYFRYRIDIIRTSGTSTDKLTFSSIYFE